MANKPKHIGPMAGVRVIDLTSMVFGPYATQIMADMGADIIKIEPPSGDDTRNISHGPVPGMSGVFVAMARAVVAGALSALLLLAQRAPWPQRGDGSVLQ